MEKICEYCGAEFKATRKTQRFCTTSCSSKWWSRYYWRGSHEKICLICGKKFASKRSSRKYCSDKCLWDAKDKTWHVKVCRVCKKEFKTSDSKRKQCLECATKKPRKLKRIARVKPTKSIRAEQNELCWLCKKPLRKLVNIHHLDNRGEHSEGANNKRKNLITLHPACHCKFHQISLIKENNKWYVKGDILNMLDLTILEVK